jgi:hypothetical protein
MDFREELTPSRQGRKEELNNKALLGELGDFARDSYEHFVSSTIV